MCEGLNFITMITVGYTLHPTPFTLHPTSYTLHPAPHTLHPSPDTVHPTPYTLHAARCTLHPTPCTTVPHKHETIANDSGFGAWCSGNMKHGIYGPTEVGPSISSFAVTPPRDLVIRGDHHERRIGQEVMTLS